MEQSSHKSTAQEFWGIGNITGTLTRLGENITREHQTKAASGEYRITKPPNKPWGYVNLGVSAALILVAAILKRLAAGQSSVAKENTQSKLAGKCKIPRPPNKQFFPNPAEKSPKSPKYQYNGTWNTGRQPDARYTALANDDQFLFWQNNSRGNQARIWRPDCRY